MKTKTKQLALLEIAIVLCAVFCASASGIATAVASDIFYQPGPLDVFGNANEDDTIDMRDTTYIKLVIFGKKPKTELADANNDGKVSMLDVGQTKLIILGKEKKLTFVDVDGKTATVHKPVERIVVAFSFIADGIRVLGAKDRVVGVADNILKTSTYFPELSKKPSVGSRKDLDVEAILELDPDLVTLDSRQSHTPELEDKLKGTGTDVARLGISDSPIVLEEMRILGYILDEEENARIYSEWLNECLSTIDERVSVIPENEKHTVFLARPGGTTCGGKSSYAKTVERAGGINIAAELDEYPEVDPEWVIKQNPDVIIGIEWSGGYETDDVNAMKARYDVVIGKPGFECINAVKNNRVYTTWSKNVCGVSYVIGVTQFAKWLYPDLFDDLDPQALHQEYVDKFCPGLDFDVREQGIFVYHPEEHPDGR